MELISNRLIKLTLDQIEPNYQNVKGINLGLSRTIAYPYHVVCCIVIGARHHIWCKPPPCKLLGRLVMIVKATVIN